MIDLFLKGGPLMGPILLCSIIGLAIWIAKCLQFRALRDTLDQPVERLRQAPPTLLAPLVAAVARGGNDEELSLVGTQQVRVIERGLSWLELIVSLAPLLGLTGTVTGMIKCFMVMAEVEQVNPTMLAGGIWEALITTAAGLFVAMPLQVGHHFLERQADAIALELREFTLALKKDSGHGV